jgi:hypothetical protein
VQSDSRVTERLENRDGPVGTGVVDDHELVRRTKLVED